MQLRRLPQQMSPLSDRCERTRVSAMLRTMLVVVPAVHRSLLRPPQPPFDVVLVHEVADVSPRSYRPQFIVRLYGLIQVAVR